MYMYVECMAEWIKYWTCNPVVWGSILATLAMYETPWPSFESTLLCLPSSNGYLVPKSKVGLTDASRVLLAVLNC